MLLQNKKPTLQKGQKDEVPCWLNSETKLAAYIFLLHHFAALSFLSSFNSGSAVTV